MLVSCIAAMFALPKLSQAQQPTIIQWNFEALPIGTTLNPAPSINNSAGAESAAAIGMQLFNGVTTNNPDVLAGASGDTGVNGIADLTQEWRIRGNTGNGWTSTAGIGTQGAQFNVDTTGYANPTVSFDWYLTTQGEGRLQLEYTDDGINWSNVPITIPVAELGTNIVLINNTLGSDTKSVPGYYVSSITSGQEWYTNLSATITDPQAANNPNFGVRLVNASTGTSCVNSKGAALNNSSGNWRFDNINITGQGLPKPFVAWTFDNLPIAAPTLDPAPSLDNSLGAVSAEAIGMQLFGGGTTNYPDVLQGTSGDTGSDGITNYTLVWRVRGNPGNGWTSTAGIGTQGAQFNADTTGYTNLSVAFDWYLTSQGEGHLQLEYTDDGIDWSNVPITVPAAELGAYLNVSNNTDGLDPDSVQGYYVADVPLPLHQEWFTNLQAVITDPAAANNTHFGIRLVNASTGTSCVNSEGGALNNSSGNWRFDNIIISGVNNGSSALTPPAITPSTNATVDAPFTNTFTDNGDWRANISSIKVGGVSLPTAAYVISPGEIVYTPAASALLQKAGTVNISISATNFGLALLQQVIGAGVPAQLVVSGEPQGPTGNGGTLVLQPSLKTLDQYGNISTSGTATYTAMPNGGWSFGAGSGVAQLLTNGVCNFTNLSAVSAGAVSGATITFMASGASGLGGLPYTTTNSTAFNIPPPATSGFTPGNIVVEQLDANSANTTFSMLELNPNVANQAVPVNTFPVPATGTNGLRNSSSGSTGRLSDSEDGTLVLFSAGLCSDSTVSDVTGVNSRGCGSFNSSGNYVLQTTYTGLGTPTDDQARSATTVDDATFWMGDKGGVYTNNQTPEDAYIAYTVGNEANVRSLKAYNGSIYALQQAGGSDPQASVMAIVTPPSSGVQELQELEGFPVESNVLDFCAIASGVNGTNIDTIYYIDGTNSTSGAIFKFTNSFTMDPETGDPIWGNAGGSQFANWPTSNGGDGLAVRTNASGGFDLFYTTGSGSTFSNQVVMVHDSAAWDQPINLTATNILYTATASTSFKGVAFAPVTTNSIVVTYPIGVLGNVSYSFSGANKGFNFSFTSSPSASGSSFTVWGTTNIAVPFSQWINLGHPVEMPPGTYNFTDSTATNSGGFYRVTSP